MLAVPSLLPRTIAEIASHAGDDGAPLQRLPEQRLDIIEILGGQLRQGAAEIVRDRELGGEDAGEAQFLERIGVVERHRGRSGDRVRRYWRRPLQGRTGQAQLAGELLDPLKALVDRGLSETAIAMQRDWPVDRSEGAKPLIRVLDEQFVVEQPPP